MEPFLSILETVQIVTYDYYGQHSSMDFNALSTSSMSKILLTGR